MLESPAVTAIRLPLISETFVGRGASGASAGLLLPDPGPPFRGLSQAHGQRLHDCTRITSAIPLDEAPIAPASHQQVLAADLQRGLSVLPGQQQGRRMECLQLQSARSQQLLRLQDRLLAEPGHRNRAVSRLRTVGQRDVLQVIQQHRLHLTLQRQLQAAPGQRWQLQFQQDQVARIEAGMHRSPRMPQTQRRQRGATVGQHLALVQLRPVHRAVGVQTLKRRQAHPTASPARPAQRR